MSDLTPTNSSIAPIDDGDWRPLPRRGARLYALPYVSGGALCGMVIAMLPLLLFSRWENIQLGSALAILWVLIGGFGLGAVGYRRHRYIRWRLDDDGFSLRTGNWWRSERLVPISRVQHLDVSNGPYARRLNLATLTIHTAGTHLAVVSVPLLDANDAEWLREQLSHQLETDDAL